VKKASDTWDALHIIVNNAGFTAEEAAKATMFFASPLSDYVSGQVLICGGGLSF